MIPEKAQRLEESKILVTGRVMRPGKVKATSSRSVPSVANASRSVNHQPSVGHRALIEAIIRLIDFSKWDKYNDWLAIGINLKSLILPEDERFNTHKWLLVGQLPD